MRSEAGAGAVEGLDHALIPDAAHWLDVLQEKVLDVVSGRADELKDLMRPDIATETVREWLDSL